MWDVSNDSENVREFSINAAKSGDKWEAKICMLPGKYHKSELYVIQF